MYYKGPSNPRYKTSLCKKFGTPEGCPYGEKCQFAHGEQELRIYAGQPQNLIGMNMYNPNMFNKTQNNLLNYKIVKCKNWEKDKTCKYGAHCTFAHSDEELRNKTDNLYQINSSFQMMMPMMFPPGMDMAQMQQFMVNNPMNFGMGIPNAEQAQNNTVTNIDKKE